MGSDSETLKRGVRETYARVARGGPSCCGGADVVASGERMGYAGDDADRFAEVANLGLGCGAPLGFAGSTPR